MDQRGSGTVAVVAVVAMAALVLAGVVQLATDALALARARTAADAAALAAAYEGAAGASRVAAPAGAYVQAVSVAGNQVTASVSVDDQTASATAVRIVSGGGTGSRAGLAPAMLAALARADELLGVEVPIVSGYRSPEHQQRLWDARHTNPYPVARPGTSLHELGLAVDVPLAFVQQLLSVAGASGLCHPLAGVDPVHFIVCPNPR